MSIGRGFVKAGWLAGFAGDIVAGISQGDGVAGGNRRVRRSAGASQSRSGLSAPPCSASSSGDRRRWRSCERPELPPDRRAARSRDRRVHARDARRRLAAGRTAGSPIIWAPRSASKKFVGRRAAADLENYRSPRRERMKEDRGSRRPAGRRPERGGRPRHRNPYLSRRCRRRLSPDGMSMSPPTSTTTASSR